MSDGLELYSHLLLPSKSTLCVKEVRILRWSNSVAVTEFISLDNRFTAFTIKL